MTSQQKTALADDNPPSPPPPISPSPFTPAPMTPDPNPIDSHPVKAKLEPSTTMPLTKPEPKPASSPPRVRAPSDDENTPAPHTASSSAPHDTAEPIVQPPADQKPPRASQPSVKPEPSPASPPPVVEATKPLRSDDVDATKHSDQVDARPVEIAPQSPQMPYRTRRRLRRQSEPPAVIKPPAPTTTPRRKIIYPVLNDRIRVLWHVDQIYYEGFVDKVLNFRGKKFYDVFYDSGEREYYLDLRLRKWCFADGRDNGRPPSPERDESSKEPEPTGPVPERGEKILVMWHVDGKYYPGVVHDVLRTESRPFHDIAYEGGDKEFFLDLTVRKWRYPPKPKLPLPPPESSSDDDHSAVPSSPDPSTPSPVVRPRTRQTGPLTAPPKLLQTSRKPRARSPVNNIDFDAALSPADSPQNVAFRKRRASSSSQIPVSKRRKLPSEADESDDNPDDDEPHIPILPPLPTSPEPLTVSPMLASAPKPSSPVHVASPIEERRSRSKTSVPNIVSVAGNHAKKWAAEEASRIGSNIDALRDQVSRLQSEREKLLAICAANEAEENQVESSRKDGDEIVEIDSGDARQDEQDEEALNKVKESIVNLVKQYHDDIESRERDRKKGLEGLLAKVNAQNSSLEEALRQLKGTDLGLLEAAGRSQTAVVPPPAPPVSKPAYLSEPVPALDAALGEGPKPSPEQYDVILRNLRRKLVGLVTRSDWLDAEVKRLEEREKALMSGKEHTQEVVKRTKGRTGSKIPLTVDPTKRTSLPALNDVYRRGPPERQPSKKGSGASSGIVKKKTASKKVGVGTTRPRYSGKAMRKNVPKTKPVKPNSRQVAVPKQQVASQPPAAAPSKIATPASAPSKAAPSRPEAEMMDIEIPSVTDQEKNLKNFPAQLGRQMDKQASDLLALISTVWLLQDESRSEPPQDRAQLDLWVRSCVKNCLLHAVVYLGNCTGIMTARKNLLEDVDGESVTTDWISKDGEEVIQKARRNYSLWDPPLRDVEWEAEKRVLRGLNICFRTAIQLTTAGKFSATIMYAKEIARKAVTDFDAIMDGMEIGQKKAAAQKKMIASRQMALKAAAKSNSALPPPSGVPRLANANAVSAVTASNPASTTGITTKPGPQTKAAVGIPSAPPATSAPAHVQTSASVPTTTGGSNAATSEPNVPRTSLGDTRPAGAAPATKTAKAVKPATTRPIAPTPIPIQIAVPQAVMVTKPLSSPASTTKSKQVTAAKPIAPAVVFLTPTLPAHNTTLPRVAAPAKKTATAKPAKSQATAASKTQPPKSSNPKSNASQSANKNVQTPLQPQSIPAAALPQVPRKPVSTTVAKSSPATKGTFSKTVPGTKPPNPSLQKSQPAASVASTQLGNTQLPDPSAIPTPISQDKTMVEPGPIAKENTSGSSITAPAISIPLSADKTSGLANTALAKSVPLSTEKAPGLANVPLTKPVPVSEERPTRSQQVSQPKLGPSNTTKMSVPMALAKPVAVSKERISPIAPVSLAKPVTTMTERVSGIPATIGQQVPLFKESVASLNDRLKGGPAPEAQERVQESVSAEGAEKAKSAAKTSGTSNIKTSTRGRRASLPALAENLSGSQQAGIGRVVTEGSNAHTSSLSHSTNRASRQVSEVGRMRFENTHSSRGPGDVSKVGKSAVQNTVGVIPTALSAAEKDRKFVQMGSRMDEFLKSIPAMPAVVTPSIDPIPGRSSVALSQPARYGSAFQSTGRRASTGGIRPTGNSGLGSSGGINVGMHAQLLRGQEDLRTNESVLEGESSVYGGVERRRTGQSAILQAQAKKKQVGYKSIGHIPTRKAAASSGGFGRPNANVMDGSTNMRVFEPQSFKSIFQPRETHESYDNGRNSGGLDRTQASLNLPNVFDGGQQGSQAAAWDRELDGANVLMGTQSHSYGGGGVGYGSNVATPNMERAAEINPVEPINMPMPALSSFGGLDNYSLEPESLNATLKRVVAEEDGPGAMGGANELQGERSYMFAGGNEGGNAFERPHQVDASGNARPLYNNNAEQYASYMTSGASGLAHVMNAPQPTQTYNTPSPVLRYPSSSNRYNDKYRR